MSVLHAWSRRFLRRLAVVACAGQHEQRTLAPNAELGMSRVYPPALLLNRGPQFFYPVELHLQPPDLLVERRLHDLLVPNLLEAPAPEDLLRLRPELPLPLANLRRMDPVPRPQLVHRLEPLQGLLRNQWSEFWRPLYS